MKKVIGVRFSSGCKIYYFDPQSLEIDRGNTVVVETSRGTELGEVMLVREIDEQSMSTPLKNVLRIATQSDIETEQANKRKEKEAFEICQQKISEHKLDMKLVDVEYAFEGNKILFYFTAEGRIDFRELVKDLAQTFHMRIELRQIGVRDEAKMLGGLGPCGMCVCCKQFLGDFQPVSIKMAKEQNLSLSPTKISGLCGRLMCCLKYEQDGYEYMRKIMPHVGKEIQTPDGVGMVMENNPITEKTRVRITLPDGTMEVRAYEFSHATPGEIKMNAPKPAEEIEAEKIPEPGETPPSQPQGERKRPRRRRRGGAGRENAAKTE